jgi:hypothetical protein
VRLLDWMELGGTGTACGVLCCLTGCLALPGSAALARRATQLLDKCSDGRPSRGAFIDEVRATSALRQSAWLHVWLTTCQCACLTACLTRWMGNGCMLRTVGMAGECMQAAESR